MACFQCQIQKVRQADVVQQANTYREFVIMGTVAIGTGPTGPDERHEIPCTRLFVAAHGIGEVPHHIAMQV